MVAVACSAGLYSVVVEQRVLEHRIAMSSATTAGSTPGLGRKPIKLKTTAPAKWKKVRLVTKARSGEPSAPPSVAKGSVAVKSSTAPSDHKFKFKVRDAFSDAAANAPKRQKIESSSEAGDGTGAAAAVDTSKLSRMERMRLWQQQRKKQQQQQKETSASAGAAAGGSGGAAAASSTAATAAASSTDHSDEDPLEAYMRSLEGAAPQSEGRGVGAELGPRNVGVVSMEDLLSGKVEDVVQKEMKHVEQRNIRAGEEEKEAALKAKLANGSKKGGDKAGSGEAEKEEAEGHSEEEEEDAMLDDDTYRQKFLESLQQLGQKSRPIDAVGEVTAPAEGGQEGEEKDLGVIFERDDEEAMYKGEEWQPQKSALEVLREKMAKKDLKPVDHAQVEYMPIRKNFYIEAREIAALTPGEVQEIRNELEVSWCCAAAARNPRLTALCCLHVLPLRAVGVPDSHSREKLSAAN